MKFTERENFVINDNDVLNGATSDSKELLPCPFCGNTKILSGGRRNENSGNIVYDVFCSDTFNCGAKVFSCLGKEDKSEESRADAIKKWNKRIMKNV